MSYSRQLLGCFAALCIGVSSPLLTPASAQQFGSDVVGDSANFEQYVRRTCSALANKPSARSSTEQDLFARCNGAINAINNPGTAGVTDAGDILDQYIGVQNVVPQSDGLNRTNRADQIVATRMDVISGQLRGGPTTASYVPTERYMIASAGDDIPVPSSNALSREGRWDGFFNAGLFNTEQDTTSDEVGYDSDGLWVAGGLDYNVSDTAIVGAALSYVDSSSDIAAIGGLSSGGDTDSSSWSVSAYGVFLLTNSLEINGLVSVGTTEFDMSRAIDLTDINGDNVVDNDPTVGPFENVQRVATSSTDADRYEIAVGASYGHYFENGVSITPTAQLSYYHAKIDGFSETGSDGLDLTFGEQEVNSTQLMIGATLAKPISQEWGVLMPYARADAIFELQDQEQAVVARYTTAINPEDNFVIRTSPADEAIFDLAAGATANFGNGVALFGEVSSIVGHDDLDHVALTFGLRRAF